MSKLYFLVSFSYIILSFSQCLFANNTVNPKGINFNFKINTLHDDKNYRPTTVIMYDNKIYIKFYSKLSNIKKPIILINNTYEHKKPSIIWNENLAIINQFTREIRIYNPYTSKLLYIILYNKVFDYSSIQPSPKILPSEFEGFSIGTNLGISNIENYLSVFSVSLNVGYDWYFGFERVMLGLENKLRYNSNGSKNNVSMKLWDLGVLIRIKYLFTNGVNFILKSGLIYVNNSKVSSGIEDVGIQNGFAPELDIEIGYIFTSTFGINVGYSYLFSTNKTLNVVSYTIGMSYFF